ncbi:ABC transporter ATP-binding protein [Sedimentibacter hydroxybenzoicus DSM 7310]|uniref:ABC transporter ATP-binding protein n=1 Tax=Sedimentibacter hydroxybenzoicus DSM 7310 TaxID=1123245 RepID=A0A974BGV0_SEDHY|nr:ABC transporter ATP-binding protein [Sedimentibacter hydroxybenzoicus]NYB72934.1 ABC transporter ATP-binding protein [Sedimentibacter hydroxybenzoicus DSM 7310]
MRNYLFYAILCPILMILEVLADIVIPYLMSRIVDVGIANNDINYIVKLGLIMISAAVFGIILGVISSHFGAKAGLGFAAEVRKELFKKVQGFSFANLDKFSVSSLITRLTNDCNTLGQVTMMSLRMAVRAPFMMIFALIMALRINAPLAKVFMVAIPVTVILLTIILSKARPLFLQMQTRVDKVNGIIQENLIGIRVVKSFNRQKFEEGKFKERNDALRNTALKAVSIIIFFMPALTIIIYSTIISVLWFGGKQIVAGNMGSGDLISFITYITQILMSLMMLSFFFMQLMRGAASVNRIVEVLNTDSEIVEIENSVSEISEGSISFNNVSFKYPGSAEKTLQDINLNIKTGEVIGIIGSTGSSKSTLVQLIPRLYDVTGGEVKVGGIDVKNYNIKALRDNIAFVLQKNVLFSGTIRENMQWGNENASDEQIINALKQSQAWEFVSKYGDGLDHKVEQGGDNFSGGQKQRLTIARALLKAPKIIILDDSTSAVDVATDAKIQKSFKDELGDVTTIIIAQRISSIQHADRIVVMNEGKIESIGKHDTLMKSSLIYKEIYESQMKGVVGL